MLSNVEFNEGYRYVDWMLTVPLLLVETVAVLALTRAASRKLLIKLVPAAALMIALGYPGELTLETGPRISGGCFPRCPSCTCSTCCSSSCTRALEVRSEQVRRQISTLRVVLVASGGLPDRLRLPAARW